MKTLKFKPHLVQKILDGVKTSTWRLFDDKDLQIDYEHYAGYYNRSVGPNTEVKIIKFEFKSL